MGYSCLCFPIAFIDVSPVIERNSWTASHVTPWISVVHNVEIVKDTKNGFSLMTMGEIVGAVLILGIAIMFVRLLLQLLSLRRLRSRAEMIGGEGPKVYQVNDSVIPFSFGDSIYINRCLHTEEELREIIRHEFVHVRQRHSIDIMWSEIICMLNWYNPFAWLLKFSIRQNLEFIADNEVLESGVNKKEYQYLLLRVMGNNQFSIVQNFNLSSLKKRIAMMNKSKSARLNLVRFLFVLPLVVVLLLAFRSITTSQHEITRKQNGHEATVAGLTDTVPKSSVSPRKTVAKERTVSIVSDTYEISDNKAVVHLDDGRTEEYDLNDKEQKEKFEQKYASICDKTNAVAKLLPDLKKIIVAATPGVAISLESAVAVDGVVATTSSLSIQKVVDCNVNTTANSNISTVVSATSNVNLVPVTTSANGRVATVVAPVVETVGTPVINENAIIMSGDEKVLFTITKNTTRQQLDELKYQMKEKGFNLNFTEIKYDNDGKLVSITGTVESKDATGKFVATAFSKLIVYVINDGDHTYFIIDEQRAVKRVI
jgi:Antirepressor regulating drug resistance, predicted signal transduction N-terminal membrane component